MINNDILRRMRFILNINDAKVIRLFAKVHFEMTEALLQAYLKKENEEGFRPCSDYDLCRFLDGLIIEKRGLRPDASIPKPTKLDNNTILRKLRIAFELKEEEMLAIFTLAEFRISKPEITALFRKADHKHYKVCGDQILRNFLKGLSIKHRGK